MKAMPQYCRIKVSMRMSLVENGSILCDSSTSRKVLGKILSAKHLGMSQSFWDSVTVINSFHKRDAFCSDGWQQSCTITPTISVSLPRWWFFVLEELIEKKSPSIEKKTTAAVVLCLKHKKPWQGDVQDQPWQTNILGFEQLQKPSLLAGYDLQNYTWR